METFYPHGGDNSASSGSNHRLLQHEGNILLINDNKFKKATKKELKTENGIIYLILNTYNLKCYIGKTKNSFYKRYSGGTWWKNRKTSNILLQRTIQKYGYKQFQIFILEKNIQDNTILKQKEKQWALILNCYAPNGYNIRECGEGSEFYGALYEEIREKSRKARLKTYKVKKIKTNEIIEITDLPTWCKENNVKSNRIRNLLCGIVDTSEGYCLPDKRVKISLWKDKNIIVKKISTGEIITISDLELFCKENSLKIRCFKNMLSGRPLSNKDYCLPQTDIDDIKKGNKQRIIRGKVISPNGEVFHINNLSSFCKEHSLNNKSLSCVLKKIYKHHKGWTLFKDNNIGTA